VGDFGGISDKIAHAAERQHGHVTRRQLLGLGVGGGAIAHRIAAGDLVVVHAGVYAISYRRVEPVARAMAAVLACGAGAVLSHDSAAALWGLRRWPEIPEVTATGHVRRPNIHTHRSRTLEPNDIRVELNIPTVSAARAIFEIQSRLSDRQLTRAVQDARRNGHIKPTALHRLLLRCPRLRQLVDPDQNPTRSHLEDILIPWLTKHDLPIPQLNTYVNGYEVDAFFQAHGVIVELDSWEYHRDRDSWGSDRERDAHHLSYGNPTVRIIPERLTHHEAARLRRTLERHRP
jgi:hypothetical protein